MTEPVPHRSAGSAEPLPCPFCGGKPIWQEAEGGQATNFDPIYRINCSECYRIDMPWWGDKIDCIKQWNARTPLSGDVAQSMWMPIETAPRDEYLLLGWWQEWPERRWEMAAGLAGSTRGGWLHGQATHWQRLPGPPAAAQPPAAPVEADDLVEVVIACCNGQMGRDAAIEVISELHLAGFKIVPAHSPCSAGNEQAIIEALRGSLVFGSQHGCKVDGSDSEPDIYVNGHMNLTALAQAVINALPQEARKP